MNMVVSEAEGGTSGYGNYFPAPEWWKDTGANISSYQEGNIGALLMRNGSHARVLGVGTVIMMFTSGKTVLMKNV